MLINKGEITDTASLNAVLRSIIVEVVETAMQAELTDFLGYDKNRSPESDNGNRRNGYTRKEVASKLGTIAIDAPRDRNSEFEPQIVKKRQKHLAGFEDLILSMYAKGMSTREIQHHMQQIYISRPASGVKAFSS